MASETPARRAQDIGLNRRAGRRAGEAVIWLLLLLCALVSVGAFSGAFGTVELNASFYRWPREASFRSWRV